MDEPGITDFEIADCEECGCECSISPTAKFGFCSPDCEQIYDLKSQFQSNREALTEAMGIIDNLLIWMQSVSPGTALYNYEQDVIKARAWVKKHKEEK